jgi:hypothetical protein
VVPFFRQNSEISSRHASSFYIPQYRAFLKYGKIGVFAHFFVKP